MRNQTEIPGTERPVIEEIEQAADAYIDVRDQRMALTKEEIALKASLVEAMHTRADDLEASDDDDLVYSYYPNGNGKRVVVTLAQIEKLRVRKKDDDQDLDVDEID